MKLLSLNSSDFLFVPAWEYQDRLTTLQQEIDLQLTAMRLSVSTVLKRSSKETLSQIENNTVAILEKEAPIRNVVFNLDPTACTNNLRTVLNGVTEFSGFPSSSCVARYDIGVKVELSHAYMMLEEYEGLYRDVQQIVVRSFIRQNAFLTPEVIIDTFKTQYESLSANWAIINPNIEEFVKTVSAKISANNDILDLCFNETQANLAPSYTRIIAEVDICNEFDNTKSPFAKFRKSLKTSFLKLEDILPKIE